MPRPRALLLFDLDADKTSLQGLWLLLGVYLGALLVAAVLSPPIFWAVQALAEQFPENGTLEYLAGKSFHDYYDRVRWLPILVGLPWVLRLCKLTGLGALGLRFNRAERLGWLGFLGVGAGLFLIAILAQSLMAEVVRKPERQEAFLPLTLLSMLPGAVIIGILEEIVFRGLVLRIFLSAFRSSWLAVLLTAVFFATVHFKFPNPYWEGSGRVVEWHSGFYVALWTLLGPLAEADLSGFAPFFIASYVNYTLLGVVLGVLFVRSQSLLVCAGLHSGLVLAMLTYSKLYNVDAGSLHWLLGTTPLRDGFLATGLLVILLVALRCLPLPEAWTPANSKP
ncbi:MAG: lysostaphin resistance A-like protein [Opitutales bacterium]